jgi:hypothetical protein
MGEYRTPGGGPWTPWVLAAFSLLIVGGMLAVWPSRPVAGFLWWEAGLAACAAGALLCARAAYRRAPTLIRLSQSQLSSRRSNGTVIAEIPYAAIASIQDGFWSDSVTIRGADGSSRIEIPLATKGIRELLTALSERIPAYLWDLEESRSFRVSFPRRLLVAAVACLLPLIVYVFAVDGLWAAIVCCVVGFAGLGAILALARTYRISRAGITIRRGVGSRFIPVAEIASVQLKRGQPHRTPLYASLILKSGKRVGFMQADQSAVVVYRALLDMRQAGVAMS